MGILAGALLSLGMGWLTGWLDVRWFHARRPPSPGVRMALGGLIAGLSYATFLAAGFVISLLLFSGPPSPWPALLCTLLGCVSYLALAWLRSVIEPHLPVDRPRGRWHPWRPAGPPPTLSGPARWIVGLGIPALLAMYGLQCLWSQSGQVGTLVFRTTLTGGAAIALGLGWTGLGVFLHLQFFYGPGTTWDEARRNWKTTALVLACTGHAIATCWGLIRRSGG